MRKLTMLAATVAMLVALSAPVALGVMRHQCAASPCIGTASANHLDERDGNGKPDALYGKGGRGRLDAGWYTRDRDRLHGNDGRDLLITMDGDTKDKVYGGPGYDRCTVDSRKELGGGCQKVSFGE